MKNQARHTRLSNEARTAAEPDHFRHCPAGKLPGLPLLLDEVGSCLHNHFHD